MLFFRAAGEQAARALRAAERRAAPVRYLALPNSLRTPRVFAGFPARNGLRGQISARFGASSAHRRASPRLII
ncbi:hypothetical protein PSP6_150021 [Paraburkholderia tropica]|nr:hypothetical protein PSP6_150021 [Paraburkholderia tropica]